MSICRTDVTVSFPNKFVFLILLSKPSSVDEYRRSPVTPEEELTLYGTQVQTVSKRSLQVSPPVAREPSWSVQIGLYRHGGRGVVRDFYVKLLVYEKLVHSHRSTRLV